MPRSVVLLASSLALTAAATAWAQAPQQASYTVLTMGKPSGKQTSIVRADGVREYAFEYNDRGRGPKLTARVELDERGLPTSVETVGNDYLKAPVAETFTLKDGVARWRNDAEDGERKLVGPAFYVSMHSVPEELGLLANALLKAPGGRLALLPDGEAGIERTGEMILRDGDAAQRVFSYEITGLGFVPETVWLDEDNRYFATVSSWFSFVREGWESSAPQLLERQEAWAARRTREVARTLTRTPAAALAITNANLFDAEAGRSIPGATVLIKGDHIAAVGLDGEVAIPEDAEVIDADGKALLPGLWDMHVHLGPGDGILHLAAGVTSVRDLANDTDALQTLREKFDSGQEIGPRVVMSGIMDGPGPYAGPTKVLVDTQAEAQAAVDDYARLGYSGVKIYSSINPELVPTIVELAHARGLWVGGHVPAFMTAQQFVEAGADELQHINFVFLNFFDDVKDTRTPLRFTAVAERAATLDLNSGRVRAFVTLLKEKGVVVDPTLSVFEDMFTTRPGVVSAGFAPIADRLPPQVRRGLLTGGLPVPEGKDQLYRGSMQALLQMVKVLYDAGVPIVAGTDSMPGFTLHRELELYVQAGIPAPDVLRIATLGAARVAKQHDELGSIAVGKRADLVLVEGDPAIRISDIRNTRLVVKDGRIYDPAELYPRMGIRTEATSR